MIRAVPAAFVAVTLAMIKDVETSPSELIACLQSINSSSSSYLVLPSSKYYPIDRFGFNYAFNFRPSGIYHAASNADAAAAITCAATNHVPIAPRSGGHSYEGYCEGGKDGYLVIDLNFMQSFSFDKKSQIGTIGAGSRLGPIYAHLWNSGRYLMPAGTCPTVGIGGHALGGGIGLTSRKYGVLTDNVVGMTVIDATGHIRDVSANANSDLFWALRGAGGGSFGLVTEFRIQAYLAPPVVTAITVEWPLSEYSKVIEAYGRWATSAPKEITSEMNLSKDGIGFSGTYLGTEDGGRSSMARFLNNAPKPAYVPEFKEMSWYERATTSAWLKSGTLESPVVGDSRYARGRSLLYRKPISEKEKDILYYYLSHAPKSESSNYAILDMWGGMIDRPSIPAAFDNHRGVLYSLQIISEWDKGDSETGLQTCDACLKWSLDFIEDMRAAYSSGEIEAYQNYIERDLPNSLEAYYGKSLPRLKQVKGSIDPHNVFTFPQAIPLS